jgi:transcriptional antiterminator RfaH
MSSGYWGCLHIDHTRAKLALGYLALKQFETYYPRVRVHRRIGRNFVLRVEPLFRAYSFVRLFEQWHEARFAPGVLHMLLDGERPAKVPDQVIAQLKSKERDGVVVLPKAPGLQRGDKVQITHGPFNQHLALYQGMRGGLRVEVLLTFLGTQQRITLPRKDIRAV